jgi:two-component system, NtrC family, sensor kinase
VVFWRQRLLRDELSLFLERSRRSFDDLKELQAKLIQSEKLASLGQLVGGAAHEINNPLTAMLGYSDLLSASDLPPAEQFQAAQIGEQVRRTTTLVSSLLTFARQAPAKLAPIDINSVLQTAVRLIAPQLEAAGNSVRLELASSVPPVLADSNQILHVCMHLAGQISAHLANETNATLLVQTQSEGKFVLIDFSSYDPDARDPNAHDHDAQQTSGPLASPMVLNSEVGNKPSTLSLNACCRIVEEHGGRILQPSAPGNVAFRVELRVAANGAGRSSLDGSIRAAARGFS